MPTIPEDEKIYIQQTLNRIKEKTIYDGDCWRWTGAHVIGGYGTITYRNRTVRIHRFIAYVYYGLELDGKLTHRKACHKPECRFRDCWNPDHIYVGWPSENVADAIKAGTFRHAVANRGDEFDEEKWREEWIERNKK